MSVFTISRLDQIRNNLEYCTTSLNLCPKEFEALLKKHNIAYSKKLFSEGVCGFELLDSGVEVWVTTYE